MTILLLSTAACAACGKDASSKEPAPAPAPPVKPLAAIAPATPTAVAATAPTPAATAHPDEVVALGGDDKTKVMGGAKTTVASTESYEVVLQVPSKVAKGAEATLNLAVLPKKGWHFNKDFPTKLTVTPPAEVSVVKAEQSAADATKLDETGGTWTVRFTPASAGKKSFAAKLKFAVCTETTCDPKKQEIAWAVGVE